MSDPLWPHEPQHARPPCPSPTPGAYPNSCPSSQWCHPAISSSVVSFSSCPQSLPASGSFPVSQLFAWGVQSTGVSASASVLPMNTQEWFPLGWTGWITLQSKGLLQHHKSLFQHHSSKASILKKVTCYLIHTFGRTLHSQFWKIGTLLKKKWVPVTAKQWLGFLFALFHSARCISVTVVVGDLVLDSKLGIVWWWHRFLICCIWENCLNICRFHIIVFKAIF